MKRGRSFHKVLSTVSNFYSITKTTDNSTYYVLQCITPLSSDTLKDAFFHFGGDIINLTDLNKQTVVVRIAKRWGKDIIKEVAMTLLKANNGVNNYLRGGMRMEQLWWYIVFFCLLFMIMRQVYPTII